MIVKKIVEGYNILLDYRKVKEYSNKFTLYDVYRNNKFLYRTCLDKLQLKKLEEVGYLINNEEEI